MAKENRFIIKERFKNAVSKTDYSQSDILEIMADKLSVSRKMIEKYVWSNQQSAIPFYRLEMICKELNISPDYLTKQSAQPATYWEWFLKEKVYSEEKAQNALIEYLIIYYGSGSLLYPDRVKQWDFLKELPEVPEEEFRAYMHAVKKSIDSAVLECAEVHNLKKELKRNGKHKEKDRQR